MASSKVRDEVRNGLHSCRVPTRLPIHRLCLSQGLHVRRQRHFVLFVGDALAAWWQTIDQVASAAVLHEFGAGANAVGRTAGLEDFLKGKRAVVIVDKVAAGPGTTGGVEELWRR